MFFTKKDEAFLKTSRFLLMYHQPEVGHLTIEHSRRKRLPWLTSAVVEEMMRLTSAGERRWWDSAKWSCRGKGGTHTLTRTLDVPHPQSYPTTFSLQKTDKLGARPLPSVPTALPTPKSLIFLVLLTAGSQSRVHRQMLCPKRRLWVFNALHFFEVLHAWLASMKPFRIEDWMLQLKA